MFIYSNKQMPTEFNHADEYKIYTVHMHTYFLATVLEFFFYKIAFFQVGDM